MKPVNYPADAILRAYGDLVKQVFLFLRVRAHNNDFNQQELFDLADAMHNVAELLVDYGAWLDDETYRRLYLRPFDAKWGKSSIRLESFLESRLQAHLKSKGDVLEC